MGGSSKLLCPIKIDSAIETAAQVLPVPTV